MIFSREICKGRSVTSQKQSKDKEQHQDITNFRSKYGSSEGVGILLSVSCFNYNHPNVSCRKAYSSAATYTKLILGTQYYEIGAELEYFSHYGNI